MKNNQWPSKVFDSKRIIFVSLFLALGAKSQWIPAGPPNVIGQEFITTGGITYFRLAARLPGWPSSCCQRIAGYAVSRQDTDLTQVIQRETWGGICVFTFCDSWVEESVSVLGALSPGDYRLALSAVAPGYPQPQVWAQYSFSVPTNATQTLTVSSASSTNTPQLLIQVAGVSNVVYVLESSADLTNWTAIRTNLGAPVTFSVGFTDGPRHFYRTAVLPAESQRLY